MPKDLIHKADFLHSLFDTIPAFIFVVDRDVQIHHLNAAALKLMGTEKKMILLKRSGDALHCLHSTETPEGCGHAEACASCVVRSSVKRSLEGSSVQRATAKMMLLHGEGASDIHLMVTASPFRYGEREFSLLILEDITMLRNAEDALRHRAVQLEAANEELAAFSYSVSHDLKAPLRSICGFSDALMNDYGASLAEGARDYLKRISSAGIRMNQLIDDLLALSRVTEVELRREAVELSALADAVADGLKNSFADRDIEFVISPAPPVTGDGRLLRIVLENLMGNSVKFAAGRQRARIEFGVRRQQGEPVYFVRDNGAGFDMAYADKLFTPFRRLHDPVRFPGNGIGLATVRRIIHRHGGRIWAEGAVDQGATFFFTL